MISHEPFLLFTRKNDKRKNTITLNVVSVNDRCPDSWNMFSVVLQLVKEGKKVKEGKETKEKGKGKENERKTKGKEKEKERKKERRRKRKSKGRVKEGKGKGEERERKRKKKAVPHTNHFWCQKLSFSLSFCYRSWILCTFLFLESGHLPGIFLVQNLTRIRWRAITTTNNEMKKRKTLFPFLFLAHVNPLVKVWSQCLEKR